jgi:archaellum component FlaF (FlaF/FlaG flagellin family)
MNAQEKAKTEIAGATQRSSSVVAVNVTSSGDFIFGNNKYVLHVGDQAFDLYEQGGEEQSGKLTFLVPANAFNSLHENAKMYLVYGETDDQQMEALSKDSNFPCWYLGTFSKTLLKK